MNEKLRNARNDRRWSIDEAAERIGISRTTYIRWEQETQFPHGSTLNMACEAFKLTPEQLGLRKQIGSQVEIVRVFPEELLAPSRPLSGADDMFNIGIVALVLAQQQYNWTFEEMQLRTEQEMKRLDMENQRDDKAFSRRQALRFLVGLPAAMMGLTQIGSTTASLPVEEALPLYTTALPACWRYYYEGAQQELETVLPQYLSHLTTLAHVSSDHQKGAASFLSQTHQLMALLAQDRENFGEAIEHCKQAFSYGRLAEDPNLQAMALIRQQDTFYENKRYARWLLTLKDAEAFTEDITPLLRGRIFARLAFAYAHQSQFQLADRYVGLAEDTFPDRPEDDPSFFYNHTTHFVLYANKALANVRMGHSKDAWQAITKAGEFVPGSMNPRKMDLLSYQIQVAIALEDLGLGCDLFEALANVSAKIGSAKDIDSLHDMYQQLYAQWQNEKRVQKLEEYLHP